MFPFSFSSWDGIQKYYGVWCVVIWRHIAICKLYLTFVKVHHNFSKGLNYRNVKNNFKLTLTSKFLNSQLLLLLTSQKAYVSFFLSLPGMESRNTSSLRINSLSGQWWFPLIQLSFSKLIGHLFIFSKFSWMPLQIHMRTCICIPHQSLKALQLMVVCLHSTCSMSLLMAFWRASITSTSSHLGCRSPIKRLSNLGIDVSLVAAVSTIVLWVP